jgi:hypothetical protein
MVSSNTPIKDPVTVSQKEYQNLKKQSQAYQMLVSRVFELPLSDIETIVSDFKETDLYTDEFLSDLRDGLEKSSYQKNYADQTIAA